VFPLKTWNFQDAPVIFSLLGSTPSEMKYGTNFVNFQGALFFVRQLTRVFKISRDRSITTMCVAGTVCWCNGERHCAEVIV
jgi:hypothetical protein